MKLEEVNSKTQLVVGDRVYQASDVFKLFDVRGLSYEVLEDDEE